MPPTYGLPSACCPTMSARSSSWRTSRELTQREIAEALSVPLGTVKARAARGTRRLGELVANVEEGGAA